MGELYIIVIVVALVSMFLIKNIANRIYRETGVNTLNFAHKALWYVQMVGLVFGIAIMSGQNQYQYGPPSPMLLIVTIIAGIALHTVITLKAGVPNAVMTGVVQGIGGGAVAVVNALLFFLGLFTGNRLGGMFNINKDAAVAQKQLDAMGTPRMANELPDDYAKRLGFNNADEAEAAGIHTGKYPK